jgi:hypothetical protein
MKKRAEENFIIVLTVLALNIFLFLFIIRLQPLSKKLKNIVKI